MDDYKCRACSRRVDTNSNNGDGAHHIIFKSEYINDHKWNLITLCFSCHRFAHDGTKDKEGNRISARGYMIMLLDDLSVVEDFRWAEALEHLRRKQK